jgi:hyperosmotically inducible protein
MRDHARSHRVTRSFYDAAPCAHRIQQPQGRMESMLMTRAINTIAIVLMLASLVAGCQTMTGKTAGENIDDGSITASVKSKLVADKASNMTRVNVDTNNATVYLNGTVETPEHKARAEQLAWQVKGVKSVVNNLQVQRR